MDYEEALQQGTGMWNDVPKNTGRCDKAGQSEKWRCEEISWTPSGNGYCEEEAKKVKGENERNEWWPIDEARVRRRSERKKTQRKTKEVME